MLFFGGARAVWLLKLYNLFILVPEVLLCASGLPTIPAPPARSCLRVLSGLALGLFLPAAFGLEHWLVFTGAVPAALTLLAAQISCDWVLLAVVSLCWATVRYELCGFSDEDEE